MKLYHVEFEANELVEGQTSYAGPYNWVVQARDREHAEKLFFDRLKKKGLFLENANGEEDHQYSIHIIPRRAGVTEVT